MASTATEPPVEPATPPAAPAPAAGGVTSEQLHQAIEKARLEEREKLRKQLDEAKAASEKFKGELETAQSQINKLTADITAIKSGIKADGGVDVTVAIEQAVKSATEHLHKKYEKELVDLRKTVETESRERQRLSVEQLKVRLIESAGGSSALIPELVRGSNEDELKASIEESKQIFQRTVASVGATPSSQNTNYGNGGNPPTIPVPVRGSVNPGDVTPPNVRAMTPAEFAANRVALKKQAAARYQTNNPVTR